MTFDVAVVFCPFLCNLKSGVILNVTLSVGHGKWGYHCILGEFIQRKVSGMELMCMQLFIWNG